ncbi:hypothetical protein L1887_30323 [Cichorium endivia]|nr:hypothetical protein L1887_30323 [Cichorium endivia]
MVTFSPKSSRLRSALHLALGLEGSTTSCVSEGAKWSFGAFDRSGRISFSKHKRDETRFKIVKPKKQFISEIDL